MKVRERLDLVEGQILYLEDESILDKDYTSAFSTDLMSDALAFCKDDNDTTLFLTSLTNVQALRTAEVLDMEAILFVSGKPMDQTLVNMAENLGINIFQTQYTTFHVCGMLYEAGVR